MSALLGLFMLLTLAYGARFTRWLYRKIVSGNGASTSTPTRSTTRPVRDKTGPAWEQDVAWAECFDDDEGMDL